MKPEDPQRTQAFYDCKTDALDNVPLEEYFPSKVFNTRGYQKCLRSTTGNIGGFLIWKF